MEKRNLSYVQESLLELLQREHDIVSRLNEINSTIQIARNSSLRTGEYERMIESCNRQLQEVREDIRKYFSEKIGLQTNLNDVSISNNNTSSMRRRR